MSWFADWFDSHYYPLLYRHRDETEAERFILRLLEHLSPTADSHFLDLACGRGRHARFLHAQGYAVTGLDLSPKSIEAAKIHAGPGLAFGVHDMRFPYPERYDYILNLFTSFGYFEQSRDNELVLMNVHNALLPGGRFVLDFMNTPRVVDHLVREEEQVHDGITFRIERKVQNGHIVKDIYITDGESRHHYQERVQALRLADFRAMMDKARLGIVETWGDYAGGPYKVEHSPRLIIFAQAL